MDRRSFHDIINCGTDREYLKEFGSWVLMGCVCAVVPTWLSARIPWALPAQIVYWLGLAAALFSGCAALIQVLGYCSYLRRLGRSRREAAFSEMQRAVESRRPLRESVRAFGEMLETNYSWVLSMDPLEAQKRALLWHEQIVNQWQEENKEWFELRKSDEWDAVLTELGDRGSRMLQIWDHRRALFQYAVAYSTETMRAKEILAIEREIRQLQVEEARAKQKFEDQLNQASEPREPQGYLP